jgi:cyanophycinase
MPSYVRYLAPWLVAIFLLLVMSPAIDAAPAYKYIRVGSPRDAVTQPQSGFALMGGGTDLDEAFRWLCERAHGGDFLILRATGSDDYNPYVQPLCKLNSVATLILPSREAANDPFVAPTIAHAEAIFIAGGDQANYIRNWTKTPVQRELNAAIVRGVPIGGTSAGLAVMGEWAYSAEADKPDDPNLSGREALMHPFSPRITLAHGFLTIPILSGIITDSHFAKRDRMGRLLVFLVRLSEPDGKPLTPNPASAVRGIGIEQGAAVLMEPDGLSKVIGAGSAYFVESNNKGLISRRGAPLQLSEIAVQKVTPGHSFDLKSWTGDASRYVLSVQNGVLHSTQSGGKAY